MRLQMKTGRQNHRDSWMVGGHEIVREQCVDMFSRIVLVLGFRNHDKDLQESQSGYRVNQGNFLYT